MLTFLQKQHEIRVVRGGAVKISDPEDLGHRDHVEVTDETSPTQDNFTNRNHTAAHESREEASSWGGGGHWHVTR